LASRSRKTEYTGRSFSEPGNDLLSAYTEIEINGKRVPVDAAETFLTKQFGCADVLSAVLNADRFVEMPEAEQQRFLA
jgi:hypothetical protein